MAQRSEQVIPKEKTRSFLLKRQLLSDSRLSEGKAGAFRVIDQLGYLQIDTINVVERSHHLVLWSRLAGYRQDHLHQLQARDKKIFEYWAHAASFIPMKDYRFYLPAIRRKPKPGSWIDKWTKKHPKLIKEVYNRIKQDGPLTPSDFSDVDNRKRGPWWDWKPAKAALEVLFWRGDLMIKERRNFQRVYDLTERVLPKDVDTTMPSEKEEKYFFIRRALNAMGIATVQDINRYIGISGRLNKWLNDLLGTGDVSEVRIEGLTKPYFILTDDCPKISHRRPKDDRRVRFLSPFDNSIILRDHTEAIFDFKYSLECYVPKNKRKYGYFVLPILWRNRLVGRLDPKADRLRKVLLVNNLHLEDEVEEYSSFVTALADRLNDFARFNKCDHVELNKKKIPAKLFRRLSSNLI
jgi:uncharacterized protein YcaQ